MQNELTQKEQKVFTEIVDFIALNKYPPSVRELCALTGFSLNSVHGYIERLVSKGFVEHEKGKNRSLRIVKNDKDKFIDLVNSILKDVFDYVPLYAAIRVTERLIESGAILLPTNEREDKA